MSIAHTNPVALTQQLVRTPSVNPAMEPGGAGEEAVARLTEGWLKGWGYDVILQELAPGRYNVIARKGVPGGPSLLLNGHLDTVGVAGMDDPFSGEIRDGRLLGRGSCDMKAGVACALATAARLSAEPFSGELVVALTADEEHASIGMQALVASGLRADAAIVCEPTELRIMPAHKGFFWMDVHVKGRAAHGSRPDVGIDAIMHAGGVLTELEKETVRLLSTNPHPLLGYGSLHAGTISGGTAPSVYPESCHLVLERRTLPGETADGIMAEMRTVLENAHASRAQLEASIEPGLFRAGTEVDPMGSLATALAEACTRTGVAGDMAGMSAWVDACFLNEAGIPALCFGPGSIAQAHTEDEWVSVDEIEACERTLTEFARTFLG